MSGCLANLNSHTIRKLTIGLGREKLSLGDAVILKTRKVKGYWDGSSEDNGKSGCGVVIKGVDWSRWVTIIRIAVTLKIGTAMAAEVAGVCVLMGIFDVVFTKRLCVQSVDKCINSIRNKQ